MTETLTTTVVPLSSPAETRAPSIGTFGFGIWACAAFVTATSVRAADPAVGVVANVKVLSDKVCDVSSLEAWKASYIRPGMSDCDKAVAI